MVWIFDGYEDSFIAFLTYVCVCVYVHLCVYNKIEHSFFNLHKLNYWFLTLTIKVFIQDFIEHILFIVYLM